MTAADPPTNDLWGIALAAVRWRADREDDVPSMVRSDRRWLLRYVDRIVEQRDTHKVAARLNALALQERNRLADADVLAAIIDAILDDNDLHIVGPDNSRLFGEHFASLIIERLRP